MSSLLKAWLKNNLLTEDPNDFCATVSGMGSKSLNDIVDEIMKDGTENKKETIVSIVTRFQEKAMQLVLTGHNVNTGMVYMRPVIKGAIYDKLWNPEINSVYVAINQGMQLRQAISETKVELLGLSPDMLEFYSLTNMETGASDGTLTKGKNAELKGSYIKVAGENPDCGIYLVNTTTGEATKLPAKSIVINEPSRLMLLIPDNIVAGEYDLKLTTQYTKGNTLLNSPRSITFFLPVVIA
ncbi:MAG: DNA-binding domain-containing protein [Paludibacter sp.]|nr:DNA-binding domain-containing protein [Paludibacter sp.]